MCSDTNQVTERPQGAQAGGFWRNRRQRRKTLWLSGTSVRAFLQTLRSILRVHQKRPISTSTQLREGLRGSRADAHKNPFARACASPLKLTISLPAPLSLQGTYTPWH